MGSQSFGPGTSSFTVPPYQSMTVTVDAGGGGGTWDPNATLNEGQAGGNSSFFGMVANGGSGPNTSGQSSPGSASGGNVSNTPGGGGAGGSISGFGANGAPGGQCVSTWNFPGSGPAINSVQTVVVGSGGAGFNGAISGQQGFGLNNSGANGSVTITWTPLPPVGGFMCLIY